MNWKVTSGQIVYQDKDMEDLLKNGESIDLWDLMNTNGRVQIAYGHCKDSTMDYGSHVWIIENRKMYCCFDHIFLIFICKLFIFLLDFKWRYFGILVGQNVFWLAKYVFLKTELVSLSIAWSQKLSFNNLTKKKNLFCKDNQTLSTSLHVNLMVTSHKLSWMVKLITKTRKNMMNITK